MVNSQCLLFLFGSTIDRASTVFREDDCLRRTISGTGRTVVLAICRIHHPHTVINHFINTKGTEIETLSAFRTTILIDYRIPGIITRSSIANAFPKVNKFLRLYTPPMQQTPYCPLMAGSYRYISQTRDFSLITLFHQLA